MLRLLVFLVVASALAAVSVWLANNPGNVAIEWQGRTLETSVGILILAVLAVAAAAVVVVEVLRWLAVLPRRWRERRRHSREVRGYQALATGLIAAAAGNISAARTLQHEAERLLPERGSTLLLAAQTAQLEGKEEVAHLKFRQMLRSRETELLGLRGLLAQAMRVNDRDEALSLARRAYRRSPTTPWVLTTLFDLLTRAERWEEALNLIPEMTSQRLASEDQARRHRGVLHHMMAVAAQKDENRPQAALHHARQAFKLAPTFAPGAVLAATLAKQLGKMRQARRTLEDAWRSGPHPDIARAYANLVDSETPEQRLARVEGRLRSLRPDHPELRVALGELAIAAGNWDKARQELERALAVEPTARVYRLFAELERASGNPQRAQDWLAQAIDAQPDHAWVCEDTGEALPEWRPFGASGRFDVVRWSVPPRVATLQNGEHGAFLVAERPAETEEAAAAPPPPPPPPSAHDGGGEDQPPPPPPRRSEEGRPGHPASTPAAPPPEMAAAS